MRARGNRFGLGPRVIRQIERLAERRAGDREFVAPAFAVALQDVVLESGRRVGVLADRRGVVRDVLVGANATTLDLPEGLRRRVGPGRLGGVRLIHARPDGTGLTGDDLALMRLLSLDASVAVIPVAPGRMPLVEVAWLLPANADGRLWEVLPRCHASALTERFDVVVRDVEAQMRRDADRLREGFGAAKDAALLVVPVLGRQDVQWEVEELNALCRTADLAVAGVVLQRLARVDPRTVIGPGKVREVTMVGLQKGVDLLVFGTTLTPSQQRNLARETGVRVIDRNQLILDIFARHARTIEGRLQVELAQLRYNLPRLSEKDDSMSRLTGGIGALGPGETKLEMERRRARDRIHTLEQRLRAVSAERAGRRRLRTERGVPVVTLVGYTNAGKSTIFNAMTGASVRAEDRLFATLDPTTRRVRYPNRREFLLSDTVGFIRDLPKELVGAFRATLEEVETSDALVLVADASDPHLEEQVRAVRGILGDLGLGDRPTVLALNKTDLVRDRAALADLALATGGIPVCGRDPQSLAPLLDAIDAVLGAGARGQSAVYLAPDERAD